MVRARVYWADARATGVGQGLLEKTEKLWETAGFDDVISPGDSVAVKLHMGESGTTRYMRPVFVRRIVDLIRTRTRARPFVTDTCTVDYGYWVRRATVTEHLQTITAHGFTPEAVNAPIVVADGVSGRDDVEVSIPKGRHINKTYVASGIVEADAVILVTHVKGHRFGVLGGSLKNLGVGCLSQRGKLHVHSPGRKWKVKVDLANCKGCDWAKYCAQCRFEALELRDGGLAFKEERCAFDLWCWLICTGLSGKKAVSLPDPDGRGYLTNFQEAMAESAVGVARSLQPGRIGFINYAIDITPLCDCACFADTPFVADLGVFTSTNREDNAYAMVAVDKAVLDAINRTEGLPGTAAEERGCMAPSSNKLMVLLGGDPWIQLRHAEAILGEVVDYDALKVEIARDDMVRVAKRYLEKRWEWTLWG